MFNIAEKTPIILLSVKQTNGELPLTQGQHAEITTISPQTVMPEVI